MASPDTNNSTEKYEMTSVNLKLPEYGLMVAFYLLSCIIRECKDYPTARFLTGQMQDKWLQSFPSRSGVGSARPTEVA